MADVTIKTGQTCTIAYSVVQADGETAFNLTGYTVTMVLEGTSGDVHGDARGRRLQKTGTTTNAAGGLGNFSFSTTDTSSTMAPGEYAFEVWVHDDDEEIPVLSGTLELRRVPRRS